MANIVFSKSSRLQINGREFSGHNIRLDGNKVVVDGVIQDGELVGDIKIDIHGDVERLDSGSGDVTISGSCGVVQTMSGDVECGDVSGNIKTMSGDVTCGAVGGRINTMSGDITHK